MWDCNFFAETNSTLLIYTIHRGVPECVECMLLCVHVHVYALLLLFAQIQTKIELNAKL